VRVVLDANGLVSALIRPKGPPGRILERLLRDEDFELVVSLSMLEELRRALHYPKVRKYLPLTVDEVDLWADALQAITIVVEGRPSRRVIAADPADDIYLFAALDGLADYVVSGDRHLLDLGEFEGIPIVTPRTLLARLPSPEETKS
jgi:uncharacterized protein